MMQLGSTAVQLSWTSCYLHQQTQYDVCMEVFRQAALASERIIPEAGYVWNICTLVHQCCVHGLVLACFFRVCCAGGW